MVKAIEVKIGENRAVQAYDMNTIECSRGDLVVIQVDRGLEYGVIISDMQAPKRSKEEGVSGVILRVFNDEDSARLKDNQKKSDEAMKVCLRKISERKLKMQMVAAEYAFDSSKIIFFFTAEGRVDFRALVKDLARVFKVRIELKQIGVRDKAKIIGGCGICGRELCCSSYMKGFHPLSIKMPKEQGLPLNPSRISGICGRIKCCMAYEFSVYKAYSRDLPRCGEKINTEQGMGRVFDVNILRKYVRVDLGEGKIIKVDYPKADEK